MHVSKKSSKVLITGVSGAGKSTICKQLKDMGYNAFDIEGIKGLFGMYHKGTKQIFVNYDNSNPNHVKNSEWICDANRLKNLLDSKKSKISFYCGIASNMDDIIKFFDKVIVLRPDPEILNERLKNREGSDDIGNTQEGRDIVLGWKDWWEDQMVKKGSILVDANTSTKKVADSIINLLT